MTKQPNKAKLPNEAHTNRVLVGKNSNLDIIRIGWQPHNIRRYYLFNKRNFNPPTDPTTNPPKYNKGWLGKENFSYKPTNHNKEHLFQNFHFCNIVVKKTQVVVTNKWLQRQWYDIEYKTPEQLIKFMETKNKLFDKQCKEALKIFIDIYGGRSDLKILKRFSEDGIRGEDFLDNKVPKYLHVHTKLWKKVYDKKVEFYGVKNAETYITNHTVKELAPEIANEIQRLDNNLESFKSEALKPLTEQIVLHLEVQKVTLEVQKENLKMLKEQRTRSLKEQWGW